MVHKSDAERALFLLKRYQVTLTGPEHQALRTRVGEVSAVFDSHLFRALLDIRECYEVTLSSSGPEPADAESESACEAGVRRVRVTSSRSPRKVERVSGVVSRSCVNMPKMVESKLNCLKRERWTFSAR
ncbi:hypothetical protein GN956_G6592 [Arapaima gigas]